MDIRFSKKNEYIITLAVILIIAVIGVIIMGKCDPQSYSFPNDQYERLAPSLAQGHLYLDMEVDPRLETMNNPYDYGEREEVLGGHGYYDSAYYAGHYYLYFGVVPEIMFFLPYYMITGNSLSTYHVAQIYYVFALIGLFFLLEVIRKVKFPGFSFFYYLLLGISFSTICFWNIVGAPTMYGVAVISGVCLSLWSIILFLITEHTDESLEKRRIIMIVIGSLCGALVFGCRPVTAMANIAIIPFVYNILKQKRLKEIVGLILPYVLVAIALMLYNYFRFDNIFEFGHSFQLTEGNYSSREGMGLDLKHIIKIAYRSLFRIEGTYSYPPFIHFGGIFFEFPILLFIAFTIREFTLKKLKEKDLIKWIISILISVITILVLTGRYAGYVFERYKMDFSFLICICCFIIIAATIETETKYNKRILSIVIPGLSFITVITAFLLFCIPDDINYAYFNPDTINKVFNAIIP